MSDLIRPRSVTEIVDASFQLYRRSATEYMTVAALLYVPYLGLQLLVVGAQEATAAYFIRAGLVSLVGMFVKFLIQAPLIWLASEHYLGRPATALDALANVYRRLPRLAVALMMQGVMLFVGLLLLIIPSIYIAALTFAVEPIIVIENGGIRSAFSRAESLSKDLKMHILGASFLVWIIYVVILGGLVAMGAVIGSQLLSQCLQAVVMIVAFPIIPIAVTIVYYDLRIRREGFDVEWMAGTAAGSSTSSAPAA